MARVGPKELLFLTGVDLALFESTGLFSFDFFSTIIVDEVAFIAVLA